MTVKEKAHHIIENLPDTANLYDIADTIHVIAKVEQGEREIEAGKGIPHNEAIKIMKSWLK